MEMMVWQWYCIDLAMVLQWSSCNGLALVLRWSCFGLALVLRWSCSGFVKVFLQWSCVDLALVLQWSCVGLALVSFWSCVGLAVVLLVLLLAYNGLDLKIYLSRGLGSNCILVLFNLEINLHTYQTVGQMTEQHKHHSLILLQKKRCTYLLVFFSVHFFSRLFFFNLMSILHHFHISA